MVVGIIELATVLLACLSSSYFFQACLWWWDMASLFHNSINTPTYMGHWKNRSALYVCSSQGLEFMLIDWKAWLCFPNLCAGNCLFFFFPDFLWKEIGFFGLWLTYNCICFGLRGWLSSYWATILCEFSLNNQLIWLLLNLILKLYSVMN